MATAQRKRAAALDYGDDAVRTVKEGELSKITGLAMLLVETERAIAAKQQEIEVLEAERTRLAVDLIPQAMDACGQTSIGLDTGQRLEIGTIVAASISEERKYDAFSWLREKGYGALIKHQVTVVFGKGKDNVAKNFYERLLKKGWEPTQKVAVHPSTLLSFVKDQLQSGSDIPREPFGIFERREAKIVEPKAPRKSRRARYSEGDADE